MYRVITIYRIISFVVKTNADRYEGEHSKFEDKYLSLGGRFLDLPGAIGLRVFDVTAELLLHNYNLH